MKLRALIEKFKIKVPKPGRPFASQLPTCEVSVKVGKEMPELYRLLAEEVTRVTDTPGSAPGSIDEYTREVTLTVVLDRAFVQEVSDVMLTADNSAMKFSILFEAAHLTNIEFNKTEKSNG